MSIEQNTNSSQTPPNGEGVLKTNRGRKPLPRDPITNEIIRPAQAQNYQEPKKLLPQGTFFNKFEKLLKSLENFSKTKFENFEKSTDEEIKASARDLDNDLINVLNVTSFGTKSLLVNIILFVITVLVIAADYLLRLKKVLNKVSKPQPIETSEKKKVEGENDNATA